MHFLIRMFKRKKNLISSKFCKQNIRGDALNKGKSLLLQVILNFKPLLHLMEPLKIYFNLTQP